MKNTKVSMIILIVLSVILLVAFAMIALLIGKNNSLQKNSFVIQSTANFYGTEAFLQKAEKELSIASLEAAGSTAQSVSATQTIAANDMKTQMALYNSASATRTYAENIVYCDNRGRFRPNYSSNTEMSWGLKSWVAKISREEKASSLTDSWTLFYNNSKLTRHTVIGEYRWDFIVYFREPGMTYQGVFFLTGQCWLDLD